MWTFTEEINWGITQYVCGYSACCRTDMSAAELGVESKHLLPYQLELVLQRWYKHPQQELQMASSLCRATECGSAAPCHQPAPGCIHRTVQIRALQLQAHVVPLMHGSVPEFEAKCLLA